MEEIRTVSLPESSRGDRAIFFDDEPVESVLYAERRTGPSNTSAFTEARSETEAIAANLAAGKTRAAIDSIVRLLGSGQAVPLTACEAFVVALADLIPQCPRPLLPEDTGDCGAALGALVSRTELHGSDGVSRRAQTLLYRWHEGRGEYVQARSVIRPMLKGAEREDDLQHAATLVNNYGYEYLLEGRPAEAERYFERALERFTRLKHASEMANVRANVLTCRFALSAPKNWTDLVRDVCETHRALRKRRDWRVRKTMRLLAELASERGRLTSATQWARRAVAASARVPTRLKEDDEQYLRGLETACESPRD
jgi:tetratricopeptide (TPR) repeat protein